MMKKTIFIKSKKKKIKVIAEDCSLLEKTIGLMFSRREKAEILLFNFNKKQIISIHSFFVFYPFVAIWLDKNNKIQELKVVNPFIPYISSKKSAYKLVEIPLNKKNKSILSLLVDD